MTQFTTISIPADVADEIDEIHDEVAEEFAPKWATVQRGVRQLADDDDGDDENNRGRGGRGR